MAAQYEPHILTVKKADLCLAKAFGEGYTTRRQAPMILGGWSKPEPDISVVVGTDEDYLRDGPPSTALLVVEVSDTTLKYDRGIKARLYARFGILDYWILNLVDWRLEAYRQPGQNPLTRRYGYDAPQIFALGQEVTPLARPDLLIHVSDLFPAIPRPNR